MSRISPTKRAAVFARDGHHCVWCGCTSFLTVDHIIPLAMGGTSALDNLQVLCEDCNRLKADGYYGRRQQVRWRSLEP
jgi:5-methylcytosine-specific restriction endonuclease McrA